MNDEISSQSNELSSVEEIEAKLNQAPLDLELKEDLAYAYLDRYLFGSDQKENMNPSDLERVRMITRELPEPLAVWQRAYLAYFDGRYEQSAKWLTIHVSNLAEDQAPLTCDELYFDFVQFFLVAPQAFWNELATAIAQNYPESGAAFTAYGIAADLEEGGTDTAASYFVQALEKDSNYWLAAWTLGQIYSEERNWQSASAFYAKALTAEVPKSMPEFHSAYAWCLGKLKRYEDETWHWRECLELDPEFQFARNNLGWSLYKQGRFEEALKIFDQAIQVGHDGKHPLYNRARTLSKLGRLDESLQTWRGIGSLRSNKYVESQIIRLEELKARQEKGELISTPEQEREPEVEEGEGTPQEAEGQSNIPKPLLTGRISAQNEQLLEETVERLINQGSEVFGRQLRMYESANGLNGRQYIIAGLGRIDLLTEDVRNGDLVVVELKRHVSHESVVGQIAMYMQWAREHLAKDNQNVSGIICVFSASPKLKLAAQSVPGLDVFEYGLTFQNV